MTATIVGLDLSLTGTGIATEDGEQLAAFPKLRGLERIVSIRDAVLKETSNADLVVIEDYAFSRAASHAHELGELGGVVKVALREEGIAVVLVGPSALKKWATGKGNATKPDMRMARLKRTGVDERDDNKNDAWWLRQLALYAYGDESLHLPALQAAVAGALTWPQLRPLDDPPARTD